MRTVLHVTRVRKGRASTRDERITLQERDAAGDREVVQQLQGVGDASIVTQQVLPQADDSPPWPGNRAADEGGRARPEREPPSAPDLEASIGVGNERRDEGE